MDHAIYRSIKTTEVKKGVEVTENDKRSSLLRYRVNQGHNVLHRALDLTLGGSKDLGAAFTTLHFLHNVILGPIDYSVCPWQAFQA